MRELKPGWRRVKFGEVVRLGKERSADPAADGLDRYVGLEHLEPGDLRIRSWGNVADGTTFTTRFRPGQVLFGKRRAYQRKVAVADFEGVCSGDIYVFESANPKHLLPELLPFICQTDAFFDYAVGTSAGSLSPRTNWTSLAEYEFALPPLGEQGRMVATITRIEAARISIQDSIIAGELALRSLSRHLFSSQPLECPRTSFGSIAHILDPNPSHRYPEYVDSGIPLVSTQDFQGRDSFTFEKAKCVPENTWREQNERCSFSSTDVVFARKGILGLARPYGNEQKAFSHTVVLMKPKEGLLASYLLWLVRSDQFTMSLLRLMNSNSGVPTLGVKTIEACPISIPTMEAQESVSDALEQMSWTIVSAENRLKTVNDIKHTALQLLRGESVQQ